MTQTSESADSPPRRFTPQAYTAEHWEAEHHRVNAKSEEWSKRLLTSLAIGNAAGLVAIASTLPETAMPLAWQLKASQAFAFGTVAAGLSMLFRERFFNELAYRMAWLAREPERFPGDIRALLIWRDRPWWAQPFRPTKIVDGVDPRHPALTGYFTSTRWNALGNIATVASATSFIAALLFALWR